MFISVTFRILSFRTLPFIPQEKKSALNFLQITHSELSAFRVPQNTPSLLETVRARALKFLWHVTMPKGIYFPERE